MAVGSTAIGMTTQTRGCLAALACLAATLVVVNLGLARMSTTEVTSLDNGIFSGLPIPDHDPALDLDTRFHLLFAGHLGTVRIPPYGSNENGSSNRHPAVAAAAAGGRSSSGDSTAAEARDSGADQRLEQEQEHGQERQHVQEKGWREAASWNAPQRRPFSRLVVVPDLHGDSQQALRALVLAGLVAPNATVAAGGGAASSARDGAAAVAAGHYIRSGNDGGGGDGGSSGSGSSGVPASWGWEWGWVGGDALLLQLGDVVDRGSDSLALLGLFERLRAQARAAGGDVVMLLGNHELMNVHQDFRYISRSELRSLAIAGGLPPLWPGALTRTETQEDDSDDRGSNSGSSRSGASDSGASLRIAVAYGGAHGRVNRLVQATAEDTQQQQQQAEEPQSQGRYEAGLEAAVAALRQKQRQQREEHEGLEEERSLAAESVTQHAGSRGGSPDRELLYDRDSRRGSSNSGRSGGSGAGRRGMSLLQRQDQHQPQQQQQKVLLRGLDIWRAALAPDQPLGALIRRRPLAAIIDAGGCRILAVHAGAFPWMLDAVDYLVFGSGGGGGGAAAATSSASHNSDRTRGMGERDAGAGGIVRPVLQPEHYVAAWNGAVAASLKNCDGRWCLAEGSQPDPDPRAAAYVPARTHLADLLLGGEGAVWSRRYLNSPLQEVCLEVAEVVRRLGVQRVVVGHTVQRGGRVSTRCGGKLLMADVGLSRAIAGEMAVLQCTAGTMQVLYGSGRMEEL